jgi:hypothetical protein
LFAEIIDRTSECGELLCNRDRSVGDGMNLCGDTLQPLTRRCIGTEMCERPANTPPELAAFVAKKAVDLRVSIDQHRWHRFSDGYGCSHTLVEYDHLGLDAT